MEKMSESDRLFEELTQKGCSFGEFRDMREILRKYKEAKTKYENASSPLLQGFLYYYVEAAEKDFVSFCEYYGLDRYDINQLIK